MANFCPSDLAIGACFPESCPNMVKPASGSLKTLHISKCHRIIWKKGRNIPILADQDGNKYILVASTTREQAQSGILDPVPQLPEGWTLTQVTLEEDFELMPEGHSTLETPAGGRKKMGEFACGYTLIWDEHDNQYHQFEKTTGTANLKLNPIKWGLVPYELMIIAICATTFIVLVIILGTIYRFR